MKAKQIIMGLAILTAVVSAILAVLAMTNSSVPFVAVVAAAKLFHLTLFATAVYGMVKWVRKRRRRKFNEMLMAIEAFRDSNEAEGK